MAQLTGCVRYRPDDMILEGGSITVDGEGTVIVTDQCLLSPGRTASAVLAEEADETPSGPPAPEVPAPGARLRAHGRAPEGVSGRREGHLGQEGIDPEETNGHIDDVATFIAPGVVAVI